MSTPLISFDFTQVYTSLTPSGSGLQAPALGSVYISGLGKKYKFVKNAHTSALDVGDAVTYDLSGGLMTTVIQPTTATLNLLAGFAMGAIPASGYGWVQIKGVGSALIEGTTDVAIGDTLKGVNGQDYVVIDVDVSSTPVEPALGNYAIALAAQTSATPTLTSVQICCDAIA